MANKTRAFLIVLGVLTLLSTAVVSASDGELELGEPAAPPALDAEEALQVDAELIAKAEGISVEHARAVLDHQERMDALQEKIHQLDPAAYGGAVHAPLPEISTTIYVKGRVSREARALVARELQATRDGVGQRAQHVLNMPGPRVQIATSEFSLRDMEDLSNRAVDGLHRAGLQDFSVGVDVRSRTIEIDLSDQDLERIRLTASEVLGTLDVKPGAEVRVRVVRSAAIDPQHSYGGGQLTKYSTNWCTSGFVVERISDGVDGVLTANHCVAGPLTKYKETNGNTYNIVYQGSSSALLGDAAWCTTSHFEYDDFFYAHWSRRDVHSLKNHIYMDVGDLVCRYGRATGQSPTCPAIKQLFVAGNVNGTIYRNLIRTYPSGGQGGDSGGPWYVGGTAWGIHTGTHASSGDSFFTSVSVVDGNMGVRLRTS